MSLNLIVNCTLDGATVEMTVYDETAGTQESVTLSDGSNSYTLSTLDYTTGNDYSYSLRQTAGGPTAGFQLTSVEVDQAIIEDNPPTVTVSTSASANSTVTVIDSPGTVTATVSASATVSAVGRVDAPPTITATVTTSASVATVGHVDTPPTVTSSVSATSVSAKKVIDNPPTISFAASVSASDQETFRPSDFVVSAAQPIEYVEESSFAQAETDPTMEWIGLVTDYESSVDIESERYPMSSPDDNVSTWKENRRVRDGIKLDLTYHPQNLDFLKYFTGADGGVSDSVSPIQFGEIDEIEFRRFFGALGQQFELSVVEGSPAEVSTQFLVADYEDWTTTDYASNHAFADDSEPLQYNDLSDIKYDGDPFQENVTGLKFVVQNDFKIFTSSSSSLASEIDSVWLNDRVIRLELELNYKHINFYDTLLDYSPKTFEFDVGNTTFTLTDVQFPEFKNIHSPGELKGETITSDPIADLTYA